MPARKPTPKSLDIPGQVQNLKTLNLKFKNEEKAKETLNEISYYRLIKAYGLSFKPRNGKYDGKVTFEQIVKMYNFDACFRQLVVQQIEHIEIEFRAKMTNYFSTKYGSLGYENPKNFRDKHYHRLFLQELHRETSRSSRSVIVQNFQEHYKGGKLPFYAVAEIISFGAMSKFYKNLLPQDKKAIAAEYKISSYGYFESWLESITYIRNICAHYGRLHDLLLGKAPRLPKGLGISNQHIFAVLYCMKKISQNSKEWHKFVRDLNKLVKHYPGASVKIMGFPPKWKKILRN